MPSTIEFGPLSLLADRLGELAASRVLVVASSRRHVTPLTEVLAPGSFTVFGGARVHVPIEVVDAATVLLDGHDTIVAIGGGSAIGLGKALRLSHDVRFVAVPTTYAGSEMTTLFGITRGRDKQTGRDPRVRPDLVIYDPTLTLTLPIALTAQSLVNALAHVVSVLSTHSLDAEAQAEAHAAAGLVLDALEVLVDAPDDLAARARAQRGASACAIAIDRGKPGAQHGLAHLLGGATGIDHAPLHAVLLPAFLGHLRATEPAVVDELERAVGRPGLDARLRSLLARAGAPTTLDGLDLTEAMVTTALATRPELPAAIARAAQR